MGLVEIIRALASLGKGIKTSIEEKKENDNRYLKMNHNELLKLPDNELCDAVWFRIDQKVSAYKNIIDGIASLSTEEQTVYSVFYMELEVNNGGICQFFVNSSRYVAPIVSKSLENIGANEYKKLYDSFIEKHNIDVNDLSSFDCNTTEEFSKQYERYPYEEFDIEFFEMDSTAPFLAPYIRSNIDKF